MTSEPSSERLNGGWIALDKPTGISSARAVARVRRVAGFKKAGHAGTLDPLASGILPIALGEATKVIPWLVDRPKTYVFTISFGIQTSTDDAEGETIATSKHMPSQQEIEAALPAFRGNILQKPPIYSAIKVDGERAYKLARAGDLTELPAREVYVETFSVLALSPTHEAEFCVKCGKGTYIRSLARDLALKLGTVGHVSALRRTAVGRFGEAGSISLAKLEDLGHIPRLLEGFYPTEHVLDDIPALAVSDEEARRLRDGRSIQISRMQRNALETETEKIASAGNIQAFDEAKGIVGRAMNNETLIAIVEILADSVKPKRVFNL